MLHLVVFDLAGLDNEVQGSFVNDISNTIELFSWPAMKRRLSFLSIASPFLYFLASNHLKEQGVSPALSLRVSFLRYNRLRTELKEACVQSGGFA